MTNDVAGILISKEQLSEKVAELAKQISKDYKDRQFIMVAVLKGSFIFAADLMREMDISVNINFMAVSSYGAAAKSSGAVKILKDLDTDVNGKDVLIVEDIIDSGLTLSYLKQLILTRGAKSVRICTILNKPARRKVDIEVDYLGFDIPDEFVVGYGLDYNECYRNLPYIGILKREIYET